MIKKNKKKEIFPLVSIVIPAYNHEKYIEKSILSVIKQSYPNIELIVINDGSSDSTLEVIKNLRKKFDFKICNQNNQGQCQALNRGIREYSKGEYIGILASDDFWAKEKISLQMKKLINNKNSDFCFSQAVKFSQDSEILNNRIFPKKCLSGNLLRRVFLSQHVPAGTILFKRSLYEDVGGFDENLEEEDWDFVIKCASLTQFTSVNKPLLFYRIHGNNYSLRNRKLIFQQKVLVLAKHYQLVNPLYWYLCLTIHFVHDFLFPFLVIIRLK